MDTPISLLHLICIHNNTKVDYVLLSREGQVHMPTFTYQVQVNDHCEEASGQSKKKAKHLAAKKMIESLMNDSKLIIKDEVKKIFQKLKSTDDDTKSERDRSESICMKNDSTAGVSRQKTQTENQNDDQKCITSLGVNDLGNPIGKLQEICMKKHWYPPLYEPIGSSGSPHERLFTFECRIENMGISQKGNGKSKKIAKREAAEKMLAFLRDEHLDKVDEILDRIPKRTTLYKNQEHGAKEFNLRNELIAFQNEREKNRQRETEFYRFFSDLKSQPIFRDHMANLQINLQQFLPMYLKENPIEDVEKKITDIANLIHCQLILTLHPGKSQSDHFQYWAELISNREELCNLSILTTWGSDEDLSTARQKALSRLYLLLLSFVSINDTIQFRNVSINAK
ncbi:Interferon-inducible double-stranded RNA-dependent protein kinase activator A -like protein A [Sarcoptes scabiei]|uniref:Interferon-inducible double-stranded RNA-dependent protein kinase activator A -like protein A n=1 Tax=Sarcoptes scabiei TaxID=52283 RepID=A0A132AKS3_SARSC|nr:Interferon-inducible double-stranded RNA-dependent protein kinase activator A -like protein A [Sarcoptes scabiei]KPM11602.1 RISC-loading complex subunit-like protein [Sarcoptes scabiei]